MIKKNIFFALILFSFLLYTCKKENITTTEVERGSVIGKPELIGTYPKILIKNIATAFGGSYASNVNFDFDVDVIKVVYGTVDPIGTPTKASGLLVIPKNTTKALPLLSFQHGTILNKIEVPSRLKGGGEAGLIFATEGYVTVCPDYLGLGDGEGLHPYMHGESEATSIIDLIRAAKSICKSRGVTLNDQLFLTGYSQGGHATLAALKMIEEQFSSEFTLTACAPMAGPYDLSKTQLDFVLSDEPYAEPGYLPYILFAYNKVYNMYPDLGNVFVSPYYDQFKQYFNDNPTAGLGAVNQLWPSPGVPKAVLKPEIVQSIKEDAINPLNIALRKNDLYDWTPASSIQLCHCDGDKHVPYENAEIAYQSFINRGAQNVKLVNPLPGGTHSTCVLPSILYTLGWFNSLKQ